MSAVSQPAARATVWQAPGLPRLRAGGLALGFPLLGLGVLFALWWFGGYLISANPATASFAGFAPRPALAALLRLLSAGEAWAIAWPSLYRVGLGLLWATLLGFPLGVLVGRYAAMRAASHLPFQLLRMISPLAWMPIAVLAFSTWDSAIVFLIAAAAIWPITFASANGIRRIDPQWFRVGRNLGAREHHLVRYVVLPAILQDVLMGLRLAIGIAWIVLVPAEYLGVTSGLGYAINDARDTLEYDRLAAIVILIGGIGFVLDAACLALIRRFAWAHHEPT